ncbi:glycerophosphodiester phosphodiesterase [Brevibacillus laterosporus]|uniref:glycerophosphodiester phosphodiesterase n=1 Tax=Brevibacillus laterosporus TaxID=1465 RepID=UPI000839B8CE|nr:glycerophosphodiester phosphodiesterase family protein [Brevibacillus laterosporus]
MHTLIYAHRGASGMYPENTFPAFHAAYLQGSNGMEIDVQVTADEQLIVMHDTNVEHTTDGVGEVRHLTYEQIYRLNAAAKSRKYYPPTKVPELSDVLLFVKTTGLRLIIELKNFIVPQPQLEEHVIRLIHDLRLHKQVVISSFNYHSLLHVKELDPQIRTGMLYFGQLHKPWEIAKQFRADELHAPEEQVNKSLLQAARQHHLSLLAWTVNTPERMQELFSLQIDGIITNYPNVARKYLNKK